MTEAVYVGLNPPNLLMCFARDTLTLLQKLSVYLTVSIQIPLRSYFCISDFQYLFVSNTPGCIAQSKSCFLHCGYEGVKVQVSNCSLEALLLVD